MSDQMVRRLAELAGEVARLRRERVTHKQAQVTAADAASGTFTAVLPDGKVLGGVAAPAQFLPAPGQWVRLRLAGATPIYDPAGIAENAVTSREIAPGTIEVEQLAQDLLAQLAGAIIHRQPAQPDPPPAGRQAYWWDADDGNRLRQYNPATGQWEAVGFGTGAIDPHSLIASDVLASGTVSAELLEAVLVLATVLIAGDPGGEHAALEPTGLHAYAVDPDDGLPTQVAYFGRSIGVRNAATGLVVAGISDEGVVSGSALSIEDPDPVFGGIPLSVRDWERPWGLVGYAELPDIDAYTERTNSELGFLELAFDAQPGRAYALRSEPVQFNTTTGTAVRWRIRRTTNGSIPTVASPQYREVAYLGASGGTWVDRHPMNLYLGGLPIDGAPETWRLLMSYGVAAGSTGVAIFQGETMFFWVEDLGPLRDNIGVVRAGAEGGAPPPPPPSAPKVTRTVEYAATWTRSWRQNNTSVSNDDKMYQGYGDSFNGIQRAACGFPSVTSLLSGATINSVYVYMYAEHWWNMSGGTLRLGYHGSLSEPASFPGHDGINHVGFTARGQGKWIRVDTWPGWKTALQNGSLRGISIGAGDTNPVYYGRFTGAAGGRPRLKITYTK